MKIAIDDKKNWVKNIHKSICTISVQSKMEKIVCKLNCILFLEFS